MGQIGKNLYWMTIACGFLNKKESVEKSMQYIICPD